MCGSEYACVYKFLFYQVVEYFTLIINLLVLRSGEERRMNTCMVTDCKICYLTNTMTAGMATPIASGYDSCFRISRPYKSPYYAWQCIYTFV
jgi:hypothetical protein